MNVDPDPPHNAPDQPPPEPHSPESPQPRWVTPALLLSVPAALVAVLFLTVPSSGERGSLSGQESSVDAAATRLSQKFAMARISGLQRGGLSGAFGANQNLEGGLQWLQVYAPFPANIAECLAGGPVTLVSERQSGRYTAPLKTAPGAAAEVVAAGTLQAACNEMELGLVWDREVAREVAAMNVHWKLQEDVRSVLSGLAWERLQARARTPTQKTAAPKTP